MADYIKAHEFSSNHKADIQKDQRCGCFYCLRIYDPKEIVEWIKDSAGTAMCPYCGIDSVIGESSGYSITVEFLKKMHENWF